MSSSNRPMATKDRLSFQTIHGISTRSTLKFSNTHTQLTEIFLQHAQQSQYFSGGAGLVKKGVTHNGKVYAVKIYGRSIGQESEVTRARLSEYYGASLLQAETAVNANRLLQREAFHLIRDKKIYFISPWIDGTAIADECLDMDTHFLNLPFEKRYKMAIQLIEQVYVLHKANYIHGDLKPSNVMYDKKGDVFLIDLDSVRNPNVLGSYPCSLDFLDYKTFFSARVRNVSSKQDLRSDVYALGIVLLMMLPELGKVVIPKSSRLCKQVSNSLASTIPAAHQSEAEQLRQSIKSMLNETPDLRPSLDNVLQLLKKISDSEIKPDHCSSSTSVVPAMLDLKTINVKETKQAHTNPIVSQALATPTSVPAMGNPRLFSTKAKTPAEEKAFYQVATEACRIS